MEATARHKQSRRPGATWRLSLGMLVLVVAVAMSSLGAAASTVPGPRTLSDEPGNPAAIGLGEPTFRLRMTPVDVSFGNNTWPLADIDPYLDDYIPRDVRERFIADMPDGGFRLTGEGAVGMQLGIGSFSASAGVRGLASGGVAKDLMELVLLGNERGREYSLHGTDLGVAVFGDTAVGVSLPVGNVRLGARYHQLLGLAYMYITGDGKLYIPYDPQDVRGDFSLEYGFSDFETDRLAVQGEGSAFDVGVAWQVTPGVSVGAAVFDIGQLQWDNVMSQSCKVAADAGAFDPDADLNELGDCSDETIGSKVWQLPRRYEASVGWQMTQTIHLGAAYTLTVRPVDGGFVAAGATEGALRAAVTWDVFRFLQLNAMATMSEADGLVITTGAAFRLGPLQTRARIGNVQALFGEGSGKSVHAGLDFGIVF